MMENGKQYIEKSANSFVCIPHKEKKIGLPVAFNASRILEYSTTAGVASKLQLSSFK
jgi:hypothetical protein